MVPFRKVVVVCAVFQMICFDLLGDGLEETDEHVRIFCPADVGLEVVVVPFLALRDE